MNEQIPPGILAQIDQIAANQEPITELTALCQAAPQVAATEIAALASILTILNATGSWNGLEDLIDTPPSPLTRHAFAAGAQMAAEAFLTKTDSKEN